MAVPRRGSARGRLPDVDQASACATTCRSCRRGGRSAACRSTRVAHHAATAAELLAELGTVDGVKPTIVEHAVAALLEAATAALRTGRLETAARHASQALDLHRADPASRRGSCWCAPRPRPIGATSTPPVPTPPTCSSGRWPTGITATRPTPGVDSVELPRCRARLVEARRELDLAIDLARSIGDERRLADTLRAREFAEVFGGSLDDARAYLDGAMEIYHEIDDERGHARGRTRTWRGSPSSRGTSPTPASSSGPTSASPTSVTPTASIGRRACRRG